MATAARRTPMRRRRRGPTEMRTQRHALVHERLPVPSVGAISKRLAGSAMRFFKRTQFAELGKFCYLWREQSFFYKGWAMADRLWREVKIRPMRPPAAGPKKKYVAPPAQHTHLTHTPRTPPS